MIDGWTFCTVIIYSYFQCVADEIKSEGVSTFKAQELVWETEYEYDPQLIIYPEDWPDITMPMMVMVKSVSLIQARYRDMRKQKTNFVPSAVVGNFL